jgi:hypothetical protein
MPYRNRIKTLEESYRLVEIQLSQLQKSGVTESDKMRQLLDAKAKYTTELNQMRRAQWDHDHETVDFEDDR